MNRRFFTTSVALSSVLCLSTFPRTGLAGGDGKHFEQALRQLEDRSQGRLGVHIIDTASGAEYGYRSDERFMMLSSHKLLSSALVLARVDQGQEKLERRIRYTQRDLVEWSPVTKDYVDSDGLSLAKLCEATITTSDNTAANLILASYGGPKKFTEFARKLGDTVTRLDRNEPELNFAMGTEPFDTTSPRAMAKTIEKLMLGKVLTPASRDLLMQWLVANTTGGKRLRAGIPAEWKIGEKTGTNRNSSNDVGMIQPPGRAPLVITVYLADSTASSEVKDGVIADVGKLVATLVN